MGLELRTFESQLARELYVCAAPQGQGGSGPGLHAMIPDVARAVRESDTRICLARVCAPPAQLAACRVAWEAAFAKEPCVPVTWLRTAEGPGIGGIQVYAVRGPQDWKPLRTPAGVTGWTFKLGDHRWAVAGVSVPADVTRGTPAEALACFHMAETALAQADMGLGSVARTWIFMDDILNWYGPFNHVRNALFQDRGLLGNGPHADAGHVPASTGIGLSPDGSARVALEFFAVSASGTSEAPGDGVKRYAAAGRQHSAYEYGSAFARAAEACTPAGRTLFVSGTAAIDAHGQTCFVDDAAGQIKMTIDNVLAVLQEAGYAPEQAVQAAAYCKTPEVARLFATQAADLGWPWLVAVGDVCRPELLFEIEVTAGAPPRSLQV